MNFKNIVWFISDIIIIIVIIIIIIIIIIIKDSHSYYYYYYYYYLLIRDFNSVALICYQCLYHSLKSHLG